jgi:hypothetical protein
VSCKADATRLETHLEHSAQNTSSSHTSLQLVHSRTGLVDVERSNHDQPRVGLKVVLGNGDLGANVFVDGVDIVFQLSRDGDDGCVSGDSGWMAKRDFSQRSSQA